MVILMYVSFGDFCVCFPSCNSTGGFLSKYPHTSSIAFIIAKAKSRLLNQHTFWCLSVPAAPGYQYIWLLQAAFGTRL